MKYSNYGKKALELRDIAGRKFRIDHITFLETISGNAVMIYGQLVLTRTWFKAMVINQFVVNAFMQHDKIQNETFEIRQAGDEYYLVHHKRFKLN